MSFLVERGFLEYAVESIELRPVQQLVIDEQDNEITALRDQLAIYDMALVNRDEQVRLLQEELGTVRDQASLSEEIARIAQNAIRRERRVRNVSGGITLAAILYAIFK